MGGVTYRRTIPQNSFENGALSKRIKIRGFESKNTRESYGDFFLEVGDNVGRRDK